MLIDTLSGSSCKKEKAKYQGHLCLFDTFSCNWPHNFVVQTFLHYIFRYSTDV